jgi:hypothetical protein
MRIFAEKIEGSFAVGVGALIFLLTTLALLFRH